MIPKRKRRPEAFCVQALPACTLDSLKPSKPSKPSKPCQETKTLPDGTIEAWLDFETAEAFEGLGCNLRALKLLACYGDVCSRVE